LLGFFFSSFGYRGGGASGKKAQQGSLHPMDPMGKEYVAVEKMQLK